MAANLGHPAEWEDLPMQFRIEVAKLLDVKSRQSFRQCSTKDKFAADDIPISLRHLVITPKATRFWKKTTFKFQTDEGHKHLSVQETIASIQRIFRHRNSSVTRFEVGRCSNFTTSGAVAKTMMKLLKHIKAQQEQGQHFNLRVINFEWRGFMKSMVFSDMLSIVNINFLQRIHILGADGLTKEGWEKVGQLDQWRNLKDVRITKDLSLGHSLHLFHYVNQVYVKVKNLEPAVLARYIKDTLEKSTRTSPIRGSFFTLDVVGMLSSSFKAKVLSHFDQNNPRERYNIVIFQGRKIITFNFPCETDYVLGILIYEDFVLGYVARTDQVGTDLLERLFHITLDDFFANAFDSNW